MATIPSENSQLNTVIYPKALIKLRINNSITRNLELFDKQKQNGPTLRYRIVLQIEI